MNKEIMYTKDCVVVCTDNGLKKRENTNNIEEILKIENNIEEINNSFDKLTNSEYIMDFFMNKNFGKYVKIVAPITLVLGIIFGILNVIPFFPSIVGIPVLSSMFTMFWIEFKALNKSKKKLKNINLKQKEIINIELENQNERLNELVKSETKNENFDLDKIGTVKKIERSKIIDNLKRKLELIVYYQLATKKDLYNENIDDITKNLKQVDLSFDDIEFIKQLLEEDLKIENENKKQKTLKIVK